MVNQPLGKTGIHLSSIGLGANYVGGHNLYENVDEKEGIRIVQRAVDLGITHIDTADAYGFGRSEELIGEAIKGRREQVVIATKGGRRFGVYGDGFSNDPVYLRGALERSLKRLQVDYIDLYYIHFHDKKTPIEEAFGTLQNFKGEGLIRAAGVSNFDLSMVELAARSGPVDALQARYNLLQRDIEGDLLSWCKQNGTSLIPWGGLAYGLLGGRYTADFQLDADDWRHRTGLFDKTNFSKNLEIVEQLKKISNRHASKTAHLAIQWLLSKPAVISVIAGAKTVSQVTDNAGVASLPLDDALLMEVDRLTSL